MQNITQQRSSNNDTPSFGGNRDSSSSGANSRPLGALAREAFEHLGTMPGYDDEYDEKAGTRDTKSRKPAQKGTTTRRSAETHQEEVSKKLLP